MPHDSSFVLESPMHHFLVLTQIEFCPLHFSSILQTDGRVDNIYQHYWIPTMFTFASYEDAVAVVAGATNCN